MMNHSFTLDMSEALMARALEVTGPSLEKRVDAVFELAYQRSPDVAERERALALAKEHGLRALCRAILNSSELIYLD